MKISRYSCNKKNAVKGAMTNQKEGCDNHIHFSVLFVLFIKIYSEANCDYYFSVFESSKSYIRNYCDMLWFTKKAFSEGAVKKINRYVS